MAKRPAQRGVTLVELLVAIFMAGIAFAALVPLFVQAQKVNSSDKARIEAVNIAQTKMELIRELDFAQVDSTALDPDDPTHPAYLGSLTFHEGDFAPTYSETVASGTKVYWIKYTVTSVNATLKRVRVEVGWDGNPKPLKSAVLQTLIYSQWGGPRTDYFDVEFHTDQGFIVGSGKATLKAIIDSADVARTTAVQFSITSRQGTVVPVQGGVQDTSDPNHRTWYLEWDISDVGDALYTFTAVAYAGEDEGNTWRRVYRIESGLGPDTPTNLVARPGDQKMLLTWDLSTSADVAHYEIRYVEESEYVADKVPELQGVAAGESLEPLYLVTGLQNDASYVFFVRGVDEVGHPGAWAQETQTPSNAHVIPPAPASNLWFSVVGPSVTLNWTASADAERYRIYTWTGSDYKPTELTPAATSQTMSLGYSATGYYQVRAVDQWSNEQLGWCSMRLSPTITPSTLLGDIVWATATTPAPPRYDMSFYNTLDADAVVTVKWLKDGRDTLPADEQLVTTFTLTRQQNSAQKAQDIGYHTTGWYRVYWTYTPRRGIPTTDSNAYGLISNSPIEIPVR